MPPDVTVLTAVRNGARFLVEMILSIRAQTVGDWEHIIVDDASDDGSAAIVERESEKDGRLRLIRRSESGGPYVAANEGLRAAQGRYIARIDADDVAMPDRLAVQLDYMARHPDLRACGGFHRGLTERGRVFPGSRRFPVLPGVVKWRLCLAADAAHSSAFVERSALVELGGYHPLPLAQDWRLWCELSRRGWLGMVPEVVVYRRVHGERLSDREGLRQAQFADDIARDHLHALSGQKWAPEDVRSLREAAHGKSSSLREGLRALDRWAALWRADESLTPEERDQLKASTQAFRKHHIRRWAESLPVGGPVVRLAGRAGASLRRAGVAVVRPSRGG